MFGATHTPMGHQATSCHRQDGSHASLGGTWASPDLVFITRSPKGGVALPRAETQHGLTGLCPCLVMTQTMECPLLDMDSVSVLLPRASDGGCEPPSPPPAPLPRLGLQTPMPVPSMPALPLTLWLDRKVLSEKPDC